MVGPPVTVESPQPAPAADPRAPYSDIAAWPPRRFTEPLTPDFRAAIDPLLPVLQIAWEQANGYRLEDWQVCLLRAITEVFPEGHPRAGQLRYRQVVISLGRQNGKSEIAAALGLWMLLRKATALVIGIASSAEQARIVYERAMTVIRKNPALSKRFEKLTDTRGIRSVSGGKYELKASKSAALQGLPIDLAVVDELHILKGALWQDLVNGTGGRPDTLVAGITTAGDPDSLLLLDLYDTAEKAITGDLDRFGAFIWEANEGEIPEDDDELGRELARANPAIASGRVDLEAVISDVRTMPPADAIRYRLNRFLKDRVAAFLDMPSWALQARPQHEAFPTEGPLVFGVDMTPERSWASIVAARKTADGTIHTQLVASIPQPTTERLVAISEQLFAAFGPVYFAADGYAVLKPYIGELKLRGIPVWAGSHADAIASASNLYARVKHKTIVHSDDALINLQLSRTVRKNVGEQFRISRADSSVEIDAVLAMALAVYIADTAQETPVQVW